MCRYVIFWVCVFSLNGTTWSYPDREVCVSLYIRSERLCLFFSFLLLLRPALDGDSSLTLPWLDTLDELCELKWVGTWRASPPWEANVALQPPTTHCRNTHHTVNSHDAERFQADWITCSPGGEQILWLMTDWTVMRACSPWMACPRCGSACASAASSDWWMVCCTPCSLSTDTQTPVWDTYKHTLWLQSQYTQTHTNCSGGDEITALAWI